MLRLFRVFLVWSVNLCVLAPLLGIMIGSVLFASPEAESVALNVVPATEAKAPLVVAPVLQPVLTPKPEPRTIRMLVTGYCTCETCSEYWVGARVWDTNGVAASQKPNRAYPECFLPKGTRLFIPGVGERIVDDTGGAMRQDAKRGIFHIDVRFANHAEALTWGRQWLDVQVLETPN